MYGSAPATAGLGIESLRLGILADPRVNCSQALVGLYLVERRINPIGPLDPDVTEIACGTGLPERVIERHIGRLAATGWLPKIYQLGVAS